MPYKHNEPRRHRIPKARYRVENWREYDVALRDRGSLTVWVTPEAIAAWHPAKTGRRGRSAHYSDLAIETGVILRLAFEEAAFSAGLRASAYVSVDDTGARHAGRACYTTQFRSDRFTAFRTGPSKSRHALSHATSWAGRRATRSMRRPWPICARPIWRMASSKRSAKPKSSNSPVKPIGGRICARSA